MSTLFEFKPTKIEGKLFKDVQYHRNGISGEGFYCAVMFDPEQKADMLITYFPEAEGICCAVYQMNILPSIKFGVNSWRGDCYVGYMEKAIKAYKKQFNRWLDAVGKE